MNSTDRVRSSRLFGDMHPRGPAVSRTAGLAILLLMMIVLVGDYRAATPGLPFTEDFVDTALRDDTQTSANWSTDEQALTLAFRKTQFGAFDPADPASAITADADATFSIAFGDVDGDGDLDLVAGNTSGQANRLYLNNGTTDPWNGVSGTGITTDAHATQSVMLGDVDGDGDLDLVAGNFGQPNRLYLGNGTADPWNGVSGSDITTDAHDTDAVALADVDNDGDLDLVVGNELQPNRLYLNNGTADPWSGVSGSDITADAHNTVTIALGDVNGDGGLDLVAGNSGQANRLYLNNGTADPWNGVSGSDITADAGNTSSATLGDVDGDGDLDLVVGNNNAQTNRLYLNNGTADPWNGVTGSDITADAVNTVSVALGDVDGDGDLDLVAGHVVSLQPNRLYLNNGTADPWNGVSGTDITSDPAATIVVVFGDVDGDGDLDLVAGNFNETNGLYFNNGTTHPWIGVSGTDITSDSAATFVVALGDVDSDGDLDLVAGNSFQTNRLYLNNGTADPWNGVTGTDITADTNRTESVTLGDVDGDGDLDLVEGNSPSRVNRLYLNNGTADPWNGVTGSDITADTGSTISVALGDVDGDGDLDLVAGNRSGQPNRLYLNNGTADPWNGVTGSDITADPGSTTSVALGDVDGDGDLDLVVGHQSTAQPNLLYLNDGVGDPWDTLVTGLSITTDVFITRVVTLGDVDGDGDLDLVAGNGGVINEPNRLYLNNGTSDPWNGVIGSNITTDAHNSQSLTLGDVDGDGDLDLVVGNSSDIQFNLLYLNDGVGDPWDTLVTGVPITGIGDFTRSVTLGDVDGDGDLDLLAGNSSGANQLYLNRGKATTYIGVISSDITADTNATVAGALGDVDNDGDLDLVAGNRFQRNLLYLNDGVGDPWNTVAGSDITTDAGFTQAVALGDVDGDGDLDLVAGHLGEPNRLYLSNGTADPWNGVTGSDITTDVDATVAVTLGDVDGDGDLDLVAGNANGEANRLYLNNGTADPWNGVTGSDITTDADDTAAVVLGDVDGDGDLDLVTATSNTNRLYLNDGAGDPWDTAVGTDITADTNNTRAVILGDVDGDGDLDLVAGNNNTNRLYLNDGLGDPWDTVSGVDITADASNSQSVALGDVNQDGHLDLVVGNQNQVNRLYFNNGTADPWNGVLGIDITGNAANTTSIALADVNRDGALDVVTGNGGSSNESNRLYRQRLGYQPAQGRATSLRVDTETGPLGNVTLTPTATLPPNTGVDYWVSNNGGVRWFLSRPGVRFDFPTSGTDLRWRADLHSLSPVLTPRIDQIQLELGPQRVGDRVWDDVNGNGIQDGGEPGVANVLVALYDDLGTPLDATFTDGNGNFSLGMTLAVGDYVIQFAPPPGFVFTLQDQGGDDALDSDVDPLTGQALVFMFSDASDETKWDAGLIPFCVAPDESVFISGMRLTTDGNNYPILDFQDPNQPSQITGYHIYRSDDPFLVFDPSSLFASDIIDMDEATPNKQWVDTSGDVPPSGVWYYQVTAYNNRCPAEGPF